MPELSASIQKDYDETDFLTPQQRLDAMADILATIALRVVNQNHEDKNS